MSILLLNEQEVRSLLTMEMALEAVEEGLRKVALDEAQSIPRSRCQTDHAMLHVLSGAAKTFGVMGYKAYSTTRARRDFPRRLVRRQDRRTDGAFASRLSRPDAHRRRQRGRYQAPRTARRHHRRPLRRAGKQARTQLLAVCKVRPITHVAVFSRNEENRRAFCAEMAPLCGCAVEPVSRPDDAARGKDIVITATSSREPVLHGDWLPEGTHLNAIGSNFISKAEIDVTVVRRANCIVIDSKEQGKLEAGDFHQALDTGILHWTSVRELGAIIVGRQTGRLHPHDITLFKSLGLGIEDVTTAARVVAKAKEQNVGRWVDW